MPLSKLEKKLNDTFQEIMEHLLDSPLSTKNVNRRLFIYNTLLLKTCGFLERILNTIVYEKSKQEFKNPLEYDTITNKKERTTLKRHLEFLCGDEPIMNAKNSSIKEVYTYIDKDEKTFMKGLESEWIAHKELFKPYRSNISEITNMDMDFPKNFSSELGNIIDIRNDFVHSHDPKTTSIADLLRYTFILYVISYVMIKLAAAANIGMVGTDNT